MGRNKDAVLLMLLVNFHQIYSQGIFDPCYFWSGAIYAGNGQCFRHVGNMLNHQDAQAACQADGASLAEVRTDQQRAAASSLVANKYTATWLGATWQDGGLKWVSDGDQVPVSLNGWSNPAISLVNRNDQCLVITTASTLEVQACAQTFGYICQIYTGSPCDTFLPGAEYFNNNCFLPLVTEVIFDVALDQCWKRYGFIVEPSTPELLSYVKQLAGWYLDSNKPLWLGIAQNGSTTNYTWMSSGDLVTWPNAWPGAGVTLTSGGGVVMDGSDAWAWRPVSRSSQAQVICQRDVSTECSGLLADGKCLVFHAELKTWTDARNDCMSTNNSYLAEPKTELLSRSVDKYLLENTDSTSVYLGAQDFATPNTFVWDYSGGRLVDGFTSWADGEPNDRSHEDVISWWPKTQRWNDVKQTNLYKYLCETAFEPVYIHSYLLVLPKEFWAGPRHLTTATLSVSTQPQHDTHHNAIQMSTFPTGQLENGTLTGDETVQFDVDIIGVSLDTSGVQHKYVLVESQLPVDVLLFYRGMNLYTCVSLVFETLMEGQSSSFFSNPSLLYNTVGFVSTDVTSASVRLGLSSDNQTVSFDFNGNSVSTRDNLQMSASLPEQYQSLYVDTLTGATTPAFVHSTGPLSVFHYGREDRLASRDATIDQVLPVTLLGSDYVTFPSLPLDTRVVDYYTVVAIYSNTVVSVFDNINSTVAREVILLWPGDSTELELPATGFHRVAGNEPFYLYAKMTGADPTATGKSGRCSVTILHEGLFRASHKLPVLGSMTEASSMFVVVVVRSLYRGNVTLVSPDGNTHSPDLCQVVMSAPQWTGCYFEVTNRTSGAVYRIEMDSAVPTSKFAAYLFARVPNPEKLLCFQLGIPEMSSVTKGEQYDVQTYTSIINLKALCNDTETTTSSPPAEVTQCPVTPNTTAVTMTSEQLEDAIEQITTHLTVEKSSLSSTKRAKESAPDERTSSTSMGYFSLIFIGTFLGLIILSDFGKLFVDMKLAIDNIRKPS